MSKELRRARPLLKGLSHFERILTHYLNKDDVELTEFEKNLKARWETAFSLLLNWRSREQAVKMLQEKYSISAATAYSDVHNAVNLFGDITKSSREGWRYILFEYNQKTLQIALQAKNLELVDKCMSRMERLADLNKEMADFNPEKLEAIDITIEVGEQTEKTISQLLKMGSINLNRVQAQEITYEDVSDAAKKDTF